MNALQENDPALIEEAWTWVLRLQEESVTQEDLASWLQWYEGSDRNKAAFDDMQAFWEQIDRVADDPDPLASELWLGAHAAPNPARASSASAVAASPGWRARARRRLPPRMVATMAASIAAGVLGTWLWMKAPEPAPAIATAARAPNPAYVQETDLPDGSKVQLAAKSSMAVQYDQQQRLLQLEDGEAYFSVAHNRQRPFVVEVGKLRVRAVGTAFNVRRAGERVVVTVSEGTVDVYPQSAGAPDYVPGPDSVRVSAGSEVAWSPEGPVVAAVDPAHALAWRQGRLEYLNEPLGSAIADINRYSSKKILIRDPAVARLLVSGAILTDATDVWLRALPSLFPVEVVSDGNGNLVVAARDGADANAAQ